MSKNTSAFCSVETITGISFNANSSTVECIATIAFAEQQSEENADLSSAAPALYEKLWDLYEQAYYVISESEVCQFCDSDPRKKHDNKIYPIKHRANCPYKEAEKLLLMLENRLNP